MPFNYYDTADLIRSPCAFLRADELEAGHFLQAFGVASAFYFDF
jgi:hypothetical protein